MGRGQGDHVGTGVPLTFRCSKERLERDWRGGNRAVEARHSNIVRTGRYRKASNPTKGHPRKLPVSVEYVCGCGHVGWTVHRDIFLHPIQEGVVEDPCGTLVGSSALPCGEPVFKTWRGWTCPSGHRRDALR